MELIELTGGPVESEFTPRQIYEQIFSKHGFCMGRMISGSKSMYKHANPDNLVVFNANVATKKSGKVFYGDIDLTFDFDDLKDVADELKEDLYILREMDGRFENENLPIEEMIKRAVSTITSKK